MLRIGIAGIGFMGMIHYLAWQKVAGAKVVAIQSRDEKKRAGDWRGIQGNFGPAGTQMDLAGVRGYAELSQLLNDPQIDVVDHCLPTEQHAEAAIAAMRSGKHVFVEKPIALTVSEADKVLTVSKATGKRVLVGHVLPFFAEFRYLLEIVQSGRLGKVQAAHFRRTIAKPSWREGQPQPDGPVVDLHIHDNHFIALAFGTPDAVRCTGVKDASGTVRHVETQYLYNDKPYSITASSGALAAAGRPFTHGYEVYLESATLHHDSSLLPLVEWNDKGKSQPNLPWSTDPIDAFAAECETVVKAITQGGPSWLDAQLARDALTMCLCEEEAVRTGKTVEIR